MIVKVNDHGSDREQVGYPNYRLLSSKVINIDIVYLVDN